jgi:hypothetical protein
MDIGSVDIDKKYVTNRSLSELIFDNLEQRTKDQWSLNRDLGLPYEVLVGDGIFFGINANGWVLGVSHPWEYKGYYVNNCPSKNAFITQLSVSNVRSIYRNLFPQFR